MKSRYFVVVPVGSKVVEEIRLFYKNTFGKDMSAVNLHMSLLPPFFIRDGVTESEIMAVINKCFFAKFEARLNMVDVFLQKSRNYLHLKVSPEKKCLVLANLLLTKLEALIEIDTSPYTNGIVPSFEAHVTIDYDFTGKMSDNAVDIPFLIDKVACFKGEGQGWKECGLQGF